MNTDMIERSAPRLNVALLSWESMYSISIGGLAAHVSELAAALVHQGHKVHVFTRMGDGQPRYDLIDGVHYHRCPFNGHPDFLTYISRMCDSLVWHFREVEDGLGRPFDLVHGHDWLVTQAVTKLKNELQRPTVFTIHSTEFGRCGNRTLDGISRNIRHFEWEGAYIANRVICVSKALGREVCALYSVPKEKVTAIYNGVDVQKFDAEVDVESVRRRHLVGLDDPLVLFAGRIAWQKGPDLLVDAMPRVLAQHPRAKFVFAGEGDMRSGLEQRVVELGTDRAVRFVGHRRGSELVDLFQSADLVCVPSRNEPFGIVILEAWSASKPVVVTRNGGPAEFVRHADTGFTVSDDSDSIGHGVEKLLAETQAARQMGRNGRREAETRFSWNTIAAQTVEVYSAALDDQHNHNHWGPNGLQEMDKMARKSTTNSRKTNGKIAGRKVAAKVAAPRTTAKSTSKKLVTEEQIRRRAHEIYLARRGAPGDPLNDWLRAENELLGGK